ncbi:MAG: aminotransferase class I/II-fold pyridoxal phosphate-dependent enzyme [Pirellulaceae bacterium]|nr:aminotransferase class I/II-fold pyridoxal phosphate-dependent enzyme [Pirellulaceae bacterium]
MFPTVDLRSDTITQPTLEMRQAIVSATLGDDVLGDDPTVKQLEETIASLLGKEAALFVPSGTMANQIAIKIHCRPGDEILAEATSHILLYEQGGYAQLAGASVDPIDGEFGIFHIDQLREKIKRDDPHFCNTRLVVLENTHNRGGGTLWQIEQVEKISHWAKENGLAMHLDGARLFNAEAATNISVSQWAEHFDTVSLCFSKGLGAPVGSVLLGTQKTITSARRIRKVLGGGMRQSGLLAAAALYSLKHHRKRLVEDHHAAQEMGKAINQEEGLSLVGRGPETNIVLFEVDPALATAAELVGLLEERKIRALAMGKQQIRLVTHLEITPEMVDYFCVTLPKVISDRKAGKLPKNLATAY